jgi:hypothetical protein
MEAMKPVYIFIIAIFLMGCSSGIKQELLVQELMETDLAFSEMSREEGMNSAFAAYCAENGRYSQHGYLCVCLGQREWHMEVGT